MANIYEKIILSELEKTQENNKKQFGFKKNSSCGHALFILRELLVNNEKKKKKLSVQLMHLKLLTRLTEIFFGVN